MLLGNGRILRGELQDVVLYIATYSLKITITHRVALETEVADPQLGPVVHLAQGIQDGPAIATGAENRLILDGRQVGALLQRLVKTGEGHDQSAGFDATRGPHIPRQTHPVAVLVLLDELLVGGHRRNT